MRARSFALLVLLAASPVGAGCGGGGGGTSGPAPVPVIVDVSPAEAWRNDALTLTITGTDTQWSAQAPPIFDPGPDFVVDSVTVDSKTVLRAAVRISYDAFLGKRLLFVSVGSTFYATPEFRVKAPISASWFSQPFVQSSVLVGVIAVNRPGDAVDGHVVAVASDGSFLPLFFDDPGGFIVVIPEDAPLGQLDVFVHRTGLDGASMIRRPGGPIGPRLSVYSTFPKQVTLPTVDGTALHRHTTTTDCFLEFPMTSSDPTLPIHFLYPHASPFAPPIIGKAPLLYGTVNPGPRAVALAGETFDVIVFSGHTSYGIDVVETPVVPVAEIEPNNGPATSQSLVLPRIVSPATMDAATGDDWFSFTAAAGDVGKIVRVVTSPGPALSVSVLRADVATTLGGASASGAGAAIDLRSVAIPAAEKLYVHVSSGATVANPDVTSSYRLFVRLENP